MIHVLSVGKPQTPCQEQYQKAYYTAPSGDRYIPHCTPDGKYFPVQCDASVCFCVDQQGTEIKKTAKLLPEFPSCDATPGKHDIFPSYISSDTTKFNFKLPLS